jgi:hypothetical protein
MVELIHKELTSQIIAAAFEVSNKLGVSFLEKVYENAMKVDVCGAAGNPKFYLRVHFTCAIIACVLY